MGRSAVLNFVATLKGGDELQIEWRIVPLREQQPSEVEVPWTIMKGTVVEIESTNQRGEASAVVVEYFDEAEGIRSRKRKL